jgi:hypothetical protein
VNAQFFFVCATDQLGMSYLGCWAVVVVWAVMWLWDSGILMPLRALIMLSLLVILVCLSDSLICPFLISTLMLKCPLCCLILVLDCCWYYAPHLSLVPYCFLGADLLWSAWLCDYWILSLCWLVLNFWVEFI